MLRGVFERFTPQAREVVQRAQAEARAMGHGSIETEHELLALFGDPDSVAGEVLSDLAITPEMVREEVIARLAPGSGELTQGQIPFSAQSKKVLELSLRESLALGHRYIGPEHLLLAIASVRDGGGCQILAALGADEERIRSEIQRRQRPPTRGKPTPTSLDEDKRVSATCPICHEGVLRRRDGPPEWYILPAATLGLPDDEEKRVGRGMPVGISVCSRCEYVALFLPPTIDGPSYQ
jgi:ATP-dependent Clp protease ATP-binding subunit ClpA